jgi:hypothetical protein
MKKITTLLLIIFIFANQFVVFAQRKIQTAPPEPQMVEIESTNPTDNFPAKGLPVSYIIGKKPSDALAASLVKEILKYDDKSLSILQATFQKAGFFIMDMNQKTLYQPSDEIDNTGMAFYDFEVVGMLKASSLGIGLSVKKMAEVISENGKDIPAEEMADWILRSLREAKKSKDERTRFVVNLIFEIGKQLPTPIDLTVTSPEDSKLNLIQASLIERLILGDLLNGFASLPQENSFFQKHDLFDSNKIRFLNAKFSPPLDVICDGITTISDLQKKEKTIIKVGEKFGQNTFIFSPDQAGNSSVTTEKPGALKKLNVVDKYKSVATGIKIVNTILAWAKLLLSLNLIEIKAKVETPMPLERTKSNILSKRGETRQVSATASMKGLDKKTKDLLDCVGKAVETTTGLKVSAPKEGPLKDKPVIWELLSKGSAETKFTSLPVELESTDGAGANRQKTDATGETKIKVVGIPQKENLEDEPVLPIIKRVQVRVNVSPEEMKKDDISKVGKLFIEAWDYSLFLGILEQMAEMSAKMPLVSKTIEVPVRDWTPCSEDWGGEINIKREYSGTSTVSGNRLDNGNSTGDGIRTVTLYENIAVTLNPRKPEEMDSKPPNPAVIIVDGKYTNTFRGEYNDNPCCGTTAGSFQTKFTQLYEEEFNEIFNQPINVIYSGGDRDYSLGFLVFTNPFKTKSRRAVEVSYTNCSLEEQKPEDEKKEGIKSLNFDLPLGRYGEQFSSPAGVGLSGTKVFNQKDGSVITWSWKLVRCKK